MVVGWASVEGRVTKECFCGLTCVASQRERIFLNFHVFWLKETHLFLIVGSFFRVWGVGVGCGNNVHLHLPAHTHTQTWCYAHTRHATLLGILLRFHIHVILWYWTFSCTSTYTSCYNETQVHAQCQFIHQQNTVNCLKWSNYFWRRKWHAKIGTCTFEPTLIQVLQR